MRTRSELPIKRRRVPGSRCAVGLSAFLVFSSAAAFGARCDSLFSARVEERGHLYSDEEVWFKAGDVITVLVSETTDARTRASTETEKESSLEASASSEFLTGSNGLNILKSGELPAWRFKGKNEHDGGGTTERKNTVSAMVSTRVVEVLPGGNLRIEGYKNLVVNREKTRITVRGIIRDRDVTPRNTVLSSQIADAEISFDGGGPLWDSQRRGLLTRLLDLIWPF